MREHPVLGIGYENWQDYHEATYGLRALPHNIFIEAGAEMGYTGLAGFVGLIGATLWVNRRTRKIAKSIPGGGNRFLHDTAHGLDGAMIGFLASGFFVTVLGLILGWRRAASASKEPSRSRGGSWMAPSEAERSSIARHLRMRGEVWTSGVRRRPAMAVVGASRS